MIKGLGLILIIGLIYISIDYFIRIRKNKKLIRILDSKIKEILKKN